MVREAVYEDLKAILELYLDLHEKAIPEESEHLESVWKQIITDRNHHFIVNVQQDRMVSSCVCVIIPNLTRNVRPYALIENVVTLSAFRGRGYATECLDYARNIAEQNDCYKMMLLTGAKDQKTLDFYKNAGYNSEDKTAFIQWRKP